MDLVTEDNITDLAVQRWATARDPRTAEVLTALVRHLHDFAREVRLTEAEWMAAIQWLTRTGQISDEKREEFILASDVLGLSMLVVQMNHRLDPAATPATVLGPFHIEGSPELDFGADMSEGLPGTPLYLHGTVRDLEGTPVAGAVLDVWQADTEGAYESQVPDVDEARLRAKYTTREDGSYCVRTIAPKGYTIPMDGPVGDLISRTEISHFRPAHIHFLINVPGFEPLITHLFEEGAEYLDSDVVFGTKQELVVAFEPREPGATPDGGKSERAVVGGALRLRAAAPGVRREAGCAHEREPVRDPGGGPGGERAGRRQPAGRGAGGAADGRPRLDGGAGPLRGRDGRRRGRRLTAAHQPRGGPCCCACSSRSRPWPRRRSGPRRRARTDP